MPNQDFKNILFVDSLQVAGLKNWLGESLSPLIADNQIVIGFLFKVGNRHLFRGIHPPAILKLQVIGIF